VRDEFDSAKKPAGFFSASANSLAQDMISAVVHRIFDYSVNRHLRRLCCVGESRIWAMTPLFISRVSAAVVLTVLLGAASPSAHHSFGVAFDATKTVMLTGVITKIAWTNPHTHVWVDVKDAKGQVVNWTLEGYPPNVLERTGWKKDMTIKVGDTLTFFGWRARDGSPYAHLREATLADGKKLFFGPPAGTGEGPATAR
jgi:hypothetical protein